MHSYICTTCGVAYPPSETPPAVCRVCDEPRQYVNAAGQGWTTHEALEAAHSNDIREQEPGLFGICTTPSVAIGQRALFIAQPGGGVIWDLTPLISTDAVEFIKGHGGVRALAISHPHFYGTMAEWSRRLDVPVYLHEADRAWAIYPAANTVFWSGETCDLGQGVTLVRCGGHFDGSTVLHWQGGADGKGVLMTGDTIMVVPDTRWMSFMRSFPNAIPTNAATVRRIVTAVEPFAFDRMYGGWWDRISTEDAKARLHRSAERYISAIS